MRRYGDAQNSPFFGNRAKLWLYVAHWLVRAYWYFEVGRPMGLSVFSQGVALGPFYILLLKPICPKAVTQRRGQHPGGGTWRKVMMRKAGHWEG